MHGQLIVGGLRDPDTAARLDHQLQGLGRGAIALPNVPYETRVQEFVTHAIASPYLSLIAIDRYRRTSDPPPRSAFADAQTGRVGRLSLRKPFALVLEWQWLRGTPQKTHPPTS
jgi:hypothetical protein